MKSSTQWIFICFVYYTVSKFKFIMSKKCVNILTFKSSKALQISFNLFFCFQVEKMNTELMEKEQKVVEMKIQVAEHELNLMERHMK